MAAASTMLWHAHAAAGGLPATMQRRGSSCCSRPGGVLVVLPGTHSAAAGRRCGSGSILRQPQLQLNQLRMLLRCQADAEHQQPQRLAATAPGPAAHALYEHALELSRTESYAAARAAFEGLLARHPTFCKAWVSYAQMEKRVGRLSDPLRTAVARQILQRGLSLNPGSGCLAQAWGLMELQNGNAWAAVRLLERCVDMDPVLQPVLRWKPVSVARMALAGSSSRRGARRGSVACAAAGPPPAAGGAAGSSGAGAGSAAAAPSPACGVAGGHHGADATTAAGPGGGGSGSTVAGGSGASGGGCMSSV